MTNIKSATYYSEFYGKMMNKPYVATRVSGETVYFTKRSDLNLYTQFNPCTSTYELEYDEELDEDVYVEIPKDGIYKLSIQ